MGDRVVDEHVVLDNNQYNAFLDDQVVQPQFDQDFDINKHLFDLILQLKYIDIANDRIVLINYITNIFQFWGNQIDPSYIDPIYEIAFGTDEANFFAIIQSLEGVDEVQIEHWIDMLSEIIISDIEAFLAQDREFDLECYLKPLLEYNNESEYLNTLVLRATKGAYNFADLQQFIDDSPSLVDLLLAPRILKARNELGISIDTLIELWEKCDDQHRIRSIHNIFSQENRKHVVSGFGSLELFERLIRADCLDATDLQNKLQDPEHFKMLASKSFKFLVDMGFESLEFFVGMTSNELQFFLSQNDLNLLLELISYRQIAYEFLNSTSVQGGTSDWDVQVIIDDSVEAQVLGGIAVTSNQYSR